MPFKTILAIVQSEEDATRVTDCAVALARRFESHLIGLHSEALPVPYTSTIGFPDAEFLQVSSEINEERAAKIETLFATATHDSGLSTEWRSLESFSGDSAHSGIATARSCDLVIVGQANPKAADSTPDVDALLFDAGRPVLVTPHDGPSVSSFRRIIIAWNGSREAARAAFDALPFILEAAGTEILVVDPAPDVAEFDDAGADIAAALSRHGAIVTVHKEESRGRSTEIVIRDRVTATGADLLVLGAYTHSWLRQLLFGGVTRHVLQSIPVSAFLSR